MFLDLEISHAGSSTWLCMYLQYDTRRRKDSSRIAGIWFRREKKIGERALQEEHLICLSGTQIRENIFLCVWMLTLKLR